MTQHSPARSIRRLGGAAVVTGALAVSMVGVMAPSAHAEFEPHWFRQPVDHFKNDSGTWQQRYWINTRHYKPGSHAPVIVIDGGETSGENRLPFLDTGIADILPKVTGGIGVILEHRCVSFAVT